MKQIVGLALFASILVVGGCAPASEGSEGTSAAAVQEGCTPGGPEVESVVVEGEFGSLPEVTFEAPLTVAETQRTVAIEGDGEPVENGDDLIISYALYNATSGDKIEDFGYSGEAPTVFRLDTAAPIFPGVSFTAACSTTGSRVVGLIPPKDAFGEEGAADFGLNPEDVLLFVIDIVSIKPPAEPPLESVVGEAREPSAGFPAVSYAESGEPTVTIPEGDVPSEFALDVVIEGEGAEVEPGAVVIVQYLGVNWNTGEPFDSSWSRGSAATFPTDGVVPGFRDGLVGQKIGSRVLIIVPADLGYGPMGGNPQAGIGATDTIVFVVDILGVQ